MNIVRGKKNFVIGVPSVCHAAQCERISEDAGRMLNEVLGGGTLILRQEDGSDRKEFEKEMDRSSFPKLEVHSRNNFDMNGEEFTVLKDTHRNRIVINVNEKFEGDTKTLKEVMQFVALELDLCCLLNAQRNR